MKINKLHDFFEINFKHAKGKQFLNFLKLCFKYHSRLFADNFFKENFSSFENFVKFIKKFKHNIFYVTIGKSNKFAAFIYLYEPKLNPFGQDCKVTFCVSRPYWGFGSYAIAKKGLKFLFEKLKVRKLSAEIIGETTLAKGLLEKLGFKCEAMLENECFKDGEFKNLYIFSKFNPAYRAE